MTRPVPGAEPRLSYPAEWEPHAATWTSWPFDDELWEGQLEVARRDFAGLVATISRYEPVFLNVRDDDTERDARKRLTAADADMGRVRFHRVPLNDVWFRDNGPLFVREADGSVALTDWRFNAWGGKYAPWDDDDRAPRAVADTLGMRRYQVDAVMEGGALEFNGRGVCITTRSCLLTPTRNPGLSEGEIEALLARWLGAQQVVWLGAGLEGDHTDGHVDTIVRFAADDVIVASVEEDEDDPNHATMRANLGVLRALRTPAGAPYGIVELPLPQRSAYLGPNRLPLTYANWYVGNGFVVVPVYDDPNDERALSVLRPLFPGRDVIGLPARGLITGGGAFHCVTQQQPVGPVARSET
ncbi:MAG TPA: agmatine deiminase family protein [Trueperaceae bacterium]